MLVGCLILKWLKELIKTVLEHYKNMSSTINDFFFKPGIWILLFNDFFLLHYFRLHLLLEV